MSPNVKVRALQGQHIKRKLARRKLARAKSKVPPATTHTMLKVHRVILKFELGAQLFRVVERVRWGAGNTALE